MNIDNRSLIQQLQKGHRIAMCVFDSARISQDLNEVSEEPFKYEQIRASRKPLRLSEKEFKYLELKNDIEEKSIPNDWGYRPHEIENQLDEKLELLPYRFRLLADDIHSLNQYNLFNSEHWIAQLDELGFQASQSTMSTANYNGGEIDRYKYGSIGEMFGLISHRITHAADNETGDEVDMILGFIEGLLFAHDIDARVHTRKSIFPNVIEALKTRSEELVEQFTSNERDANEWYQTQTEEREQELRYLSDVIEQYEIVPEQSSENVASSVKFQLESHERSVNQDNANIIENITAKEVIETVIEESLVEARQFENISYEHWERLEQKSGRGPDPKDILLFLDENGDSSSREIADELSQVEGSDRDWTAGVTESARDLAGQRSIDEHPEREIWSNHPLLNGNPDSWSLTSFGKALTERQRAYENNELSSLHSLPSEIIEELISEFDLPHGIYAETG